MSESIKRRTQALSTRRDAKELRTLLETALVDLTALRATVATNVTDVATLAAKLDDDAGVTDTDYEAGLTAAAPSALTLTS